MTSQEAPLLPDKTRAKLEQLMLSAKKIRAGAMKGDRRSVKRGTSIEFADYRNYAAGDDLRQLDWNIYARLERPYIKLLEDEEDLAVHLLLDTSASMDWPIGENVEADHNKLLFAKRIFAALAYIALTSNDYLQAAAFYDDKTATFGPTRGRGQVMSLLHYIHQLIAQGQTDLNTQLKNYAVRTRRPGLLVLISDLFSSTSYVEGLNTLLARGHEIVIIHVLSPDEMMPPLAGDLRLLDVETGQAQEVTIDATMRAIYQNRLDTWLTDIRNICSRRGVHYVLTSTSVPWEKIVLGDLRQLGVVR